MEKQPILMMNKLTNLFFRALDAMNCEKLGESITGQNMMIIGFLARHNTDIYQKDLERHFSVRRSTISKTLHIMEEKGIVKRSTVCNDARLKKIVLTDKGWMIYHLASDSVRVLEEKIYTDFTEEEFSTLKNLLCKMEKNLIA